MICYLKCILHHAWLIQVGHVGRYVCESQRRIFNSSGSQGEAPGRMQDPTGSHDEKYRWIYDPDGSHDKNMSWIYDLTGSDDRKHDSLWSSRTSLHKWNYECVLAFGSCAAPNKSWKEFQNIKYHVSLCGWPIFCRTYQSSMVGVKLIRKSNRSTRGHIILQLACLQNSFNSFVRILPWHEMLGICCDRARPAITTYLSLQNVVCCWHQ